MSKENDDQADRLIEETIEAGVMTITLNRPERMNALTEAMLLQFRAALERAAADPLTRAARVRICRRATPASSPNRSISRRSRESSSIRSSH
jgi:hypothetical protein